MKAIAIDSPGGPEALVLRDLPAPTPAAGEALVRLHAIGVNFIDVYYREGRYEAPHYPFIDGQEGAGVVEAVADGVTLVKPGDRVAFAGTLGAYAEQIAVPAEALVHVPEAVSFRDAAALMLQGTTAHYLANSTYALSAGDVALVHAGAGGVGLLLTQLAKAKGVTVLTTVSTPEKARLSREAGADRTIEYTREDFAAIAREATNGRGVDVVYDSVGATTYEMSLDSLRPRGTFVLFGASSGAVPPLDLHVLNTKGSLYATRPTLKDYIATREELLERTSDVFARVAAGTLKIRCDHEYPLAEAPRAHIDLQARKTTGKIILRP